MKQIFFIIILLLVFPAHATTMCALNDTVAVVLDPNVNVTSASSNSSSMTWSAQFPYGLISGIGACINTSGSQYQTVSHLTDSVNGETNTVVGGERTGAYCWVKVTHPAMSKWMYYWTFNNAANCLSECFGAGYYNFTSIGIRREGFRNALFGSISN